MDAISIVRDTKLPEGDKKELLCGALLGAGCSRDVYECKLDPSSVVKFRRGTDADSVYSLGNFIEWVVWQESRDNWRQFLAPCHAISPCGTFLLMAKAQVAATWAEAETFRRELPEALDTDVSPWNMGTLPSGKKVLVDYGLLPRYR